MNLCSAGCVDRRAGKARHRESADTRMGWIDRQADVAIARQCDLAEVSRATVYRRLGKTARERCDEDLLLCRLIDEEYTNRPFYGSRRMVVFLRGQGRVVNRKRVQRLMREMGLAGMAPGPATSVKHPKHKVYPYLLRGVAVTRPNHVWSDRCDLHPAGARFCLPGGDHRLVSRKVLSWRISNSMDASFCVDCLEDALREHGRPEVFNSDQGSQFTSKPSRACSSARGSPSAWTGAAGHWTTSSSSACGAT